MKQSLLIVAGPTASGKTAVCVEIAKKFPVEVISFDSMQVYRGLPIITQAPPKRCLAGARSLHTHLVSFLDFSERYDAAQFRKDAESLIEKILKRGRTPLLSGGTGLYLRMLLDGLFESEGRPHNERLRAKLLAEQKRHGGDYLHQKLIRVDAASAAKIHPNDLRRLVRALEVHALSGKPLSQKKSERSGIRESFYCPVFFLERGREDLYARIEHRVDEMVKKGLVREVRRALKKDLSMTASMALGIREIQGSPLQEAVVLLKQHTRNYAKRQLSWFRHEKGVVPIPVEKDEPPKVTARKILERWEQGKG